MRAGKNRHRLTIQQPTTVRDANYGAEMPATWADVATVFASIDDLATAGYREQDIAKTIAATVSHVVRMRHNASIKAKWRLKFGTRFFHVNAAIDVQERGRETICYCTELAAPAIAES